MNTDNLLFYNRGRTVPQEALKEIKAGRLKGFSDINPMWRIKILTEMFGPCGFGWKIEITDKRIEQGSGVELVCFVDIALYVKWEGEWSDPIIGMGGSSFVTQERNGPYTSDECFKMAYTDAISVACKSLGIAADVYFDKDRTKYDITEGDTKPKEMTEEEKTSIIERMKGQWLELGRSEEGFLKFIETYSAKGHSLKDMAATVYNLLKAKGGVQ